MTSFTLTAMTLDIEDTILMFDCSVFRVAPTRWVVTGGATNVADLREELNNQRVLHAQPRER